MRTPIGMLLSLFSGFALLSLPVGAVDTSPRALSCWAQPPPVQLDADLESLPDDIVELTTGGADIQTGGAAEFEGPVEIRSRGNLIKAGSARYDNETGTFSTKGGVEFSDAHNRFTGSDARYSTESGELQLNGAEFEISNTPARGSADQIFIAENGVVKLDGVSYTSCPPGNNSWLLKYAKIDSKIVLKTITRTTYRFLKFNLSK